MSLLSKAFGEADAKREKRVLLSVPDSSSEILCRTLTAEDVSRAEKGANRLFPKDSTLSGIQQRRALLAAACVEVWVDGETVLDSNGDPLTFRDKAFQAEAEVATASEAVSKLVGLDGDVVTLGNVLMRESGFDDDGNRVVQEGEDPTS